MKAPLQTVDLLTAIDHFPTYEVFKDPSLRPSANQSAVGSDVLTRVPSQLPQVYKTDSLQSLMASVEVKKRESASVEQFKAKIKHALNSSKVATVKHLNLSSDLQKRLAAREGPNSHLVYQNLPSLNQGSRFKSNSL